MHEPTISGDLPRRRCNSIAGMALGGAESEGRTTAYYPPLRLSIKLMAHS